MKRKKRLYVVTVLRRDGTHDIEVMAWDSPCAVDAVAKQGVGQPIRVTWEPVATKKAKP